VPPRPSSIVAAAAFGLALLLLGASALDGVPRTWRVIRAETAAYAPLAREERDLVFITRMGMPQAPFEWYGEQLGPGDRYYVHGAPGGFGQFATLRMTVRAVGRLHFLPGVEVDDPADANVIVSWQADPSALGLTYSSQTQAGQQPFYVSRVNRGH
jgi:hypothetical protein